MQQCPLAEHFCSHVSGVGDGGGGGGGAKHAIAPSESACDHAEKLRSNVPEPSRFVAIEMLSPASSDALK